MQEKLYRVNKENQENQEKQEKQEDQQSLFQKVISFQKFKCQKDKPAAFYCYGQCDEQDPLICSQMDCSCQQQRHKNCSFKKVTDLVNRINSWKTKRAKITTLNEVEQLYNSLSQTISIAKQRIKIRLQNFGMPNDMVNLINYQRNGSLKQNLSSYFFQRIQQQYKGYQQRQLAETLVETDKYIECLKGKRQYFLTKISNFCVQIQEEVVNLLKPIKLIPQSKIVVYNDEIQLLQDWFIKPVQQLKLLYRASQNNFSISKFHQFCDNKQNTVVLIQTKAQKKILGFSERKWNPDGYYKGDINISSFIGSITNKIKYQNISKYGICTKTNLGPMFGQSDIKIYENANTKLCSFRLKSYSNTAQKLPQTQQICTNFSGATVGDSIQLKQWEVYQVKFK